MKTIAYQNFGPFNSRLLWLENPSSDQVALYPPQFQVSGVCFQLHVNLSELHRAASWTIRPLQWQKWSAQPSRSSGHFLLLSSSKALSGKSDNIRSSLTTSSSVRQAEHYGAQRKRERERERKRETEGGGRSLSSLKEETKAKVIYY